ncbi:MAG: GTP-binding protein [Candidatus Lokiarchaeota archaeon]|nr:GTP-binding protein [Candidatus Lokiarchaeota archaeon]
MSELNMNYDYKWKTVVLGDPSVGKTTLMLQYTEKKFRELYIPTVGVQVSVKDVILSDEIGNKSRIGLYIWDVAGQVRFSKIRKLFYEGANAFIIVYDVTNKETFVNSSRWYKDIMDILGTKIHGCLVGNKIDLSTDRQISRKSGQLLADKMDLSFLETSAKTGENVDKLFNKIAQNIYQNMLSENVDTTIEEKIKEDEK